MPQPPNQQNPDVMNYLPEEFSEAPYSIQPNSQSDEVYSDLMREERIANIVSQLDPENILEDIEHRIKGQRRNRATGRWENISADLKPINSLLVSNFVSFLSSILNLNTTFTNLSKDEINKYMRLIIEYLVDDLDINSEEYGIAENYPERQRIFLMVCGSCFTCFKRAQDGMEARRFFTALKVSESNNSQQQQQQKKGFLEHFKFWS